MGKGCRGGRKWDGVGRGEVGGGRGRRVEGRDKGCSQKDKHEPLMTRVKMNAKFDLLLYMTLDSKRCECEEVTRVLAVFCQNAKRRHGF
jgi:hypothetical protein